MGWTDDLAEAVQTATQNAVCGIYRITPLATLKELAGDNAYNPAPYVRDYFDGICGAPDPPAPTLFGIPGQLYRVNFYDVGTGALVGRSQQLRGSIAIDGIGAEGSNLWGFGGRSNIPDNPTGWGVSSIPGSINPVDGSSRPPIAVVVLDGSETPAPPQGGGEYPPLTDAQKDELADILAQLAAIRNTQGYQNGKLSAIDAKADGLVDAADTAAGKQDKAQDSLDALKAALDALKVTIDDIKKKVDDIKTAVGNGEGTDCLGTAWGSITRGLQSCIDEVCKVEAAIGLQNGDFEIDDGSEEKLQSVMDGFDTLFKRLDLGLTTPVNQGDAPVVLRKLTDYFADIRARIGYSVSSRGVIVVGQEDKKILNAQQAIQELATYNGNSNIVVQGHEKSVLDRPTLHIVMNSAGGLAPQGFFSIPNPKIGLTKEQIKEHCKPQVRGDWYCQLELDNRRQIQGWFQSAQAGQAYLTELANLTSLAVKDKGFSATYREEQGPSTFAAKPLIPVKASLYAQSAKGQPYNVIYLQLPEE